jgi:hypothetical protein
MAYKTAFKETDEYFKWEWKYEKLNQKLSGLYR